ncbi:MAG: molecular chaperone TorD family protein [Pseudomonadota bacterium]
MAGFAITNHTDRVFLLNALELLATVFRGPDRDGWQGVFDTGLPELMAQAPSRLGHLTDILGGLQAARPADLDELESEYVRLFIAAGGGVAAPLYESCHTGTTPRVMGESALSMARRLAEAGLEPAGQANEPPDHLATEIEYLYHLLATGWTRDDPEAEALGLAFAREVMRPWTGRFTAALDAGSPHPVYAGTASLLCALLDALTDASFKAQPSATGHA